MTLSFDRRSIDLLTALLRAEDLCWPEAVEATDTRNIVDLAHYHGVTALLYRALRRSRQVNDCPTSLYEALREAALAAAARELVHQRAVTRVLDGLAARGVSALLLKGTALAYTLYPSPELRERADTDLLLRAGDLESAGDVFSKLGYQHVHSVTGELLSSQTSWHMTDEAGVAHNLDVHWRICNFQVFGDKLTFDELWPASLPIAALGPHAHGLGATHALLLACMHRLVHLQVPFYVNHVPYRDSDRLIWLYDIHLLSQSRTKEEWQELARMAASKQLQLICLDGLHAAKHAYGTAIPRAVEDALLQAPQAAALEVGRFRVPRWRWELSEVWALPTWRQRLTLLREHFVPAPAHLLDKYQHEDRRWLPLLYLRRAVAGVWKRI